MPFTPFHFGPGLAVKGSSPRAFSWSAFVFAQVLIDCETVYYWLHHQYPRHHFVHSFVGATIAGLAASCLWLVVIRGASAVFPALARLAVDWPGIRAEVCTGAVLLGGLVGGMSHPLLDGIVHRDVRPFMPFSNHNPLFGLLGPGRIEVLCVVAAAFGLVALRINLKRQSIAIRNR